MITIITALVTATVLCGIIWALVQVRKKINNLHKDLKNVNDDIVYRENKIDDRIYRVCDRVSAIEGGKHWLVVRYTKGKYDNETPYYVKNYLTKFRNFTPNFDRCDRTYYSREDAVKALSILKDCVAINQFTDEKITGSEYRKISL